MSRIEEAVGRIERFFSQSKEDGKPRPSQFGQGLQNANSVVVKQLGERLDKLEKQLAFLATKSLGEETDGHKSLQETSPDLVDKVASRLREELMRPELVTALCSAAFQQLTEQLITQQPAPFELLVRLPLAFDFLDDELRYWRTTSEEIDPAIRGAVVSTLQKIQARVHDWQSRNHLERIPKEEQGETFDWTIHAVADKSVPAPSPEMVDKIEHVEQYGYRYGKLPLRKAQVVLWSKNENGAPPAASPTEDSPKPPSTSES